MLTRSIAPLRQLLRRPTLHRRAMSSFTLDKNIFNPSLYKRVQDVWFEGVPLGAKDVDPKVAQRWFMASPEEKAAFDGVCRDSFAHALESIGPEKFPNPIVEPFLQEIHNAVQRNPTDDGAEATRTALSLTILLDQMTRNIFRTNEGLIKVYNHYDKIAYALVTRLLSTDSPIARPDLHPQWRTSLAYRVWFYMPLEHSEELEAHIKVEDVLDSYKEDLDRAEGGVSDGTKAFLDATVRSAIEHKKIIERFGRYPHRNGALGRKSTTEEEKFMTEGGATFGVAQEKKD
jgi:uncharacterized protein (DUF924 family)